MERSLSRGKIKNIELLRQEPRRTRMPFVNFHLQAGEKRTRTRKKATNDLFRKCTRSRVPRGWIPEHFIRNHLFFLVSSLVFASNFFFVSLDREIANINLNHHYRKHNVQFFDRKKFAFLHIFRIII